MTSEEQDSAETGGSDPEPVDSADRFDSPGASDETDTSDDTVASEGSDSSDETGGSDGTDTRDEPDASDGTDTRDEPDASDGTDTRDEPDAGPGRTWTRVDIVRGGKAGVAAYAVGYALVFLWFLTDGRLFTENTGWRWVGWIFYRGQFVPLDATPGGTSATAARMVENRLGVLSNVVPSLVLSLATVGAAGGLLARARGAVEPLLAAKTGASLVVGYLPLAALGVVVFAGTLSNGVHVRPSPLWALIVAGVLFPGIVGALGGLGFAYWERRDDDDDQPAKATPPDEESPNDDQSVSEVPADVESPESGP